MIQSSFLVPVSIASNKKRFCFLRELLITLCSFLAAFFTFISLNSVVILSHPVLAFFHLCITIMS